MKTIDFATITICVLVTFRADFVAA